jgi:hypothetical protein
MTRRPNRLRPAGRTLVPAACLLLFAAVCAAAQQQKPLFTIDEDCTAFAFGREGKIAFAVHHVFSQHKFDIQRDDFWISDGGHGKRRILNGDKMSRGEGGFSYAVRAIRWSPGGTKLAAEVATGTAVERHGDATLSTQTFLLDVNGQEIKIADGDSFIPDSQNAAWLDDSTVIYLEETKPRKEFTIWSVRPAAGHAERLFEETYFLGAVWMVPARQAVAVTSPERGGWPRLVLLDLSKQTVKELAALEGYVGGISVSPSGQKIAYFRDPGTLEWRTMADSRTAHDVQALIGPYYWTHDEQRVVLKSGMERRSSILQWVRLSDGASDELFHGLTFWNFAVSEDGRHIGVSPPGKHVVAVYDLPEFR